MLSKQMKKSIAGVLICFILLLINTLGFANPTHSVVFTINKSTYVVDNIMKSMDAKPFIENNRTYVPVRYLALSLGVLPEDIGWDSITQTITLKMKGETSDTTVKLIIGSKTYYVNGKTRQMDVAPIIRNGRTYLPARFVAEAFGYTVDWNESKQEVLIYPLNTTSPLASQDDAGTIKSSKLTVSFIDVGQGDSIFIQAPSGKTMLIDAGTPEMGSKVVDYIKSQGINKIDIIIATHPHSDHIGGLPAVIKNFEIGKIYAPKVTHTTKTYENFLNAVKDKGLKIIAAKAGMDLDLGEGITAKMLAPNSEEYNNLNNYSVVVKVTYKNNSFLFTGDAEEESEQEMLAKGYDLKADVLKVGHHGSNTSTTPAFLKAVNPKYAVISVGKNNTYGHPHKEVMERLKSLNITVYRTDECGTVVAVSNGRTILFNVKPGDYMAGSNGNGSTSNTSSSKTSTNNLNQSLPYSYYRGPGKVYVDSNGNGLIKLKATLTALDTTPAFNSLLYGLKDFSRNFLLIKNKNLPQAGAKPVFLLAFCQ